MYHFRVVEVVPKRRIVLGLASFGSVWGRLGGFSICIRLVSIVHVFFGCCVLLGLFLLAFLCLGALVCHFFFYLLEFR